MVQKLKDKNSSFKLKITIGMLVFAFAIVIGISTTAYAAPATNTDSKNEQISIFDPFEMTVTVYSLDISEDATISVSAGLLPQASLQQDTEMIVRSTIRVPYRPTFRSPFRPPWVHEPTAPWFPGEPPW